jgi:ribonucleoside-diphosphate reductase alpha chain
MEYLDWPEWLSDEAVATLKDGYLLTNETPKQVYELIANSACKYLNRPDLYSDLFHCLYNGWIGTASAFFSNFGRDKGLPISCNMIHLDDSIRGIYTEGLSELAALSQNGAGVAVTVNDIRPAGSPITRGGLSVGILPVAKLIDLTGSYVSQDSKRPGAVSINISILHPDTPALLRAKDHLQGDHRKHIDCNIGLTVPSIFMEGLLEGNKEYVELWSLVLETQLKTGSPYLLFEDNVNNQRCESYIKNNLKITASNICVIGSTKILTDKGYIPISSLVNTKVNIWNGTQFSNVNIIKTGTNQEVLTVKTDSGYSLTCTPYHKFYIQKGYKKGTGLNKFEILEVRAKDLKPNDKLIKFNLPIVVGEKELNLAYENGFYTGDGCEIKDNQQRIYLYDNKLSLKPYFKNAVWYDQPSQNRSYCHYSKLNKKFFIPNEEYTIQSRLNWLAGLLDSDGCLVTNKTSGAQSLQITSINKEFLTELQLMLQCLGVYSKVVKHSEAGARLLPKNNGTNDLALYDCKEAYRILIASSGITQLINLGLTTYRLNIKENNCNRESIHFIKITEVINEDYVADTYCFNEPLQHKGMFNGILTGNCQEVLEYTDKDHTFVCCLCSLNLSTWEDWKRWKGSSGKSVAELAVYLLDAGLDDYIEKASRIPELYKAVRSVLKERSIGVGVMGLHYLYQSKNLPFKSYKARQLNKKIFTQIQQQTIKASVDLGVERGIPDWCIGQRNALLRATAPTRTNSVISGAFSAGIEPNDSNYYVAKQSKGNFIRRNKHLEILLESKGKNTEEIWDSILFKNGSVFHLDFLTFDEKLVFATAREIDQQELIRQASERQVFIDQSQSLNRFYHPNIPVHIINEHIITAWNNNIKTLYYTRTASPQQLEKVKGDCYLVTKDDCKWCKELKILLDKVGIKYTEVDKSTVEHFPWRTVPQVWYEGCYIGGYEDMKTLINNKQAQIPNQIKLNSMPEKELDSFEECYACES